MYDDTIEYEEVSTLEGYDHIFISANSVFDVVPLPEWTPPKPLELELRKEDRTWWNIENILYESGWPKISSGCIPTAYYEMVFSS